MCLQCGRGWCVRPDAAGDGRSTSTTVPYGRVSRGQDRTALLHACRSPGLTGAARTGAACRATTLVRDVVEPNRRTAGLAVERFPAFADGDDGQAERDHGIGPPPAEHAP